MQGRGDDVAECAALVVAFSKCGLQFHAKEGYKTCTCSVGKCTVESSSNGNSVYEIVPETAKASSKASGGKAGMAAGIAVGIIALVGGVAALVWRRRKANASTARHMTMPNPLAQDIADDDNEPVANVETEA